MWYNINPNNDIKMQGDSMLIKLYKANEHHVTIICTYTSSTMFMNESTTLLT